MNKLFATTLVVLSVWPGNASAQSNIFDTVRRAAQDAAAMQDSDELRATVKRSRVPTETTDQDAARAANKAHNDRAYQEMIDMAASQNAKAAAGRLPPTAAVPYWHTKQLCAGRGGKKAPCRIYR
jgi:hypothetical protein